jgi:hypothetical protein
LLEEDENTVMYEEENIIEDKENSEELKDDFNLNINNINILMKI